MSIRDAIGKQILKAILDNKEEYLEAAKEAITDFLAGIKIDGHDHVVEEIKTNIETIVGMMKHTYELIVGLVDKYGHPDVPKDK